MGKSSKFSGKKDEIKDPKVYMRDTIGNISKILRYSTWDSAQMQLEKLSIRWDSYTVNQVLKTHPPMEKAWLFFNWASQLKRFKHDQFTYTTMLDIFGEAGRISSMKYVFQQMQEKGIKIDAVTYTSLLRWLSKDGDVEDSVKMWDEMKAQGCCPTVVSYTAFMKVLFYNKRSKEATEVYKEMLEAGCTPNCYTYTVLMEYLAGAGKFKAALEILNKMQDAGVQPDKAACNMLIEKCSRAGETRMMAHILQYMKDSSLVLRFPVYMEALEALKRAGESDDLLREVNPHISSEDFNKEETSECKTLTSVTDRGIVLNFLAKRNFIAVDHMLNEVIYKNTQLDSELISNIIQVNCANFRPSGALLAFNYGVRMGMQIEEVAHLTLIGFFIRTNSLSKVMEIVEEMIKAGVSLGTYHISLLIYQLGCAQMSTSAKRIFYSLPNDQKNHATYTALMSACFHSGEVDEGLEIFNTMKTKGIHASAGTYRVLILGLEEADRVEEAEIYRKEKKNLQSNGQFRDTVSLEKCLCDLLFVGGAAW
ncbi:Pentatricopeptide repeat [Macleaya cordata]|uniref:Pentatricopeptide repeat n=1 Tax=Macleaya cordata TaxID=56857 RepID=A0A200Q273_MACCD|nr:Pentatricopeptide repeat [Macleaya cordata]